jgi:hypothetical protein
MRKPGTDENNVQMSDVLCDFCGAEWTEQRPMIEGHRGSCICGQCLTIAYTDVVLNGHNAGDDFKCTLCLESSQDRAAMNRAEPGWRSPMQPDAAVCRRCIRQAAGALTKDKESGWKKPTAP